MNFLKLIAASLACFRLTRLITDDKIFDWFRSWVVREAPRKLKTKAEEGITCPFCVSFYFASFIALGLQMGGEFEWKWFWLWMPAIWGGSVLFNQIFVKLSE